MVGDVTTDEPFVLVLAIIVGALATARIVRLIVDDDWPPVVWARDKFVRRVSEDWGMLVECPFCVAPYLAPINLLYAWGSGLAWHWWLLNGWAALSYAAAMITTRDVPPESRE